ncbi:transporter [Cupriavidus consociatus]|uniref:transporter n=1 Tax=Cupriavidus consociatus TaxID=2821357 RepID=UPI001AE81F08|nr:MULTISPECIES: transporter [unclassified Cupriavidus]MBP0623167.1 transporter [Cupriavidus sp. LEh25]MDK2659861.1 transporter [Cupriavidus sp. LEh21]
MLATASVCLTMLSHCGASRAYDVLPGDIVPLPSGVTALGLYYLYGHNDEFNLNGRTFKENTGLDTHVGVVRAIHSFTIAGIPVQQNIVLPYGSLRNGEIGGAPLGTTSGYGDLSLVTQIWPLSDAERGSYVGIAAVLTAPTGTYRPGNALNLGENRWNGVLMLAGGQRFASVWRAEAYIDWHTYGDNNKAGFNGSQRLKQRDSYQAQFYLNRDFATGTSAAIGYSAYSGGAVSIDGVETGGRTQKQQLRVALSQFLNPKSLMTVELTHDFAVRGGYRQNVGMTLRAGFLF